VRPYRTLEKVADGFAVTAIHLKPRCRARTRQNSMSLPAGPNVTSVVVSMRSAVSLASARSSNS
jgi:hypothetical protein